MELRNKHYVHVMAYHGPDGTVTPCTVLWNDGRTYSVDEVLEVRRAASTKAGGNGVRYKVRIGRSTTYLFRDGQRWFVEERKR